MARFDSVDQLIASLGAEAETAAAAARAVAGGPRGVPLIEYSDWVQLDQARVSAFADATEDHQWIHLDAELAAASSFGGTIVHGYLLLSLLPSLTAGTVSIAGTVMAINYGLDKVRFPYPVRVGSRVRAMIELLSAARATRGVRVTQRVVLEIEGVAKPAMVAEPITLFVVSDAGA